MLLFLDFDGVLHPNAKDKPRFCRVSLLWRLLRSCPFMKVVFSTMWRLKFTVDEMAILVTEGGGEDLVPRFMGAIPAFMDVG